MKSAEARLAENAKEILGIDRENADHHEAARPGAIAHLARPFLHVALFPVSPSRATSSAPRTQLPRYYAEGVEWAGVCFGMYSLVCFGFSFVLPALARKLGRKTTHSLCLLCGAAGLLSVAVIHDKYFLLLSMTGVGIAWASTLSMPYAVLSGSLPPKRPASTWASLTSLS